MDSRWNIATLQTSENVKIRYGVYSEDPNNIDNFVVFINGHGEYIEKYSYLPQDLKLPPRCAFLTWDHRGQGASDGNPRLHIEDYDQLGQDAKFIVESIIGSKPYKIVAHSMGGLITVYSTMKSYLKPQKIIMSAPLFGIQHAIPESIGRFISRLGTKLGFEKTYFQRKLQEKSFEKNIFTHSLERYERRFKSPYVIEGITVGWIKSTFDAIDYINGQMNLQKFETPTKILYGDDERLVSTEAIEKWLQRAQKFSKAPISSQVLTKTRHEIFAEAPESYSQVLNYTHRFLFEV